MDRGFGGDGGSSDGSGAQRVDCGVSVVGDGGVLGGGCRMSGSVAGGAAGDVASLEPAREERRC